MIDTITPPLNPTSTSRINQIRIRKSNNRSPYDVARSVVAEYLHDWGLTDPEVIATESRRIVYQASAGNPKSIAENPLFEVNPDDLEQRLCESAIRLTISEVEASINRLEPHANSQQRIELPSEEFLMSRMASLLLDIPQEMDTRDRQPRRLLVKLEECLAPVVPHVQQREMQPQPRTKLWKILRKGYWHQLLKNMRGLLSE
jgi:hypothetical protein